MGLLYPPVVGSEILLIVSFAGLTTNIKLLTFAGKQYIFPLLPMAPPAHLSAPPGPMILETVLLLGSRMVTAVALSGIM